jgi:class 3 adenylate cyclase/predicted ATPase
MEFYEILDQILALLQRHGRVTYGALKRQFQLDDAYLEDLKAEIIEARELAVDQDGRVLLWTGSRETTPESMQPPLSAVSQSISQADHLSHHVVSPPMPRSAADAERRQLTVLFCDVVDSTVLAGRLDPEDLRDVVRAYQETCTEVIRRFDGHIAQYLGDGLLVYFGYPQAHEDDARRAVYTGLEILAAMQRLNTRLERERRVQLAMRLGIHTGLVVVGEMGGSGRQEQLALGETPNVAARLQGLAAPDTVVISAATFRLVQGYFTYDELGMHALKGVAAPVQVYRILGERAAQSRLDVGSVTGLTPLVGRDAEMTLLLERWAQSREGMGQVVLLSGEAGIGKSRLVEVLRERAHSEGATRIVFRCSPYHQNSALYPVIDHLQRFLQWQRDDTPEARLDKLEQALQTSRLPLAEVVPLFAALLSVPLSEHYPPLNLTPQLQRQKTQEALVAWLLEEAERQPVLVVWEDLHWADPSTLDTLSLVLEQVPTTRMLNLLTYRPEFRLPWVTRSHVTQVTLGRLGRPQVEAMLTSLTGGKALPADVVEQVLAKTDWVPLFVEELVKMILESGLVQEDAVHYVLTGPLPPLAIPSTLHDSLMARLDRLSTARELAQLGAVLGREFSYELLQAVALVDETTLQQELRQLVDAELVYQRGLPPRSRYVFKHALIQDAAYQSLLKSTRQQYHQRIAQVLVESFSEIAETQPELLAQHYTEAGLAQQAIPYWQLAGQRAAGRSAHAEAIGHFRQALAVLALLPDASERAQQELTLQRALGASLLTTRGFAAPEVEHVYTRARALCQRLGDIPEIFPVLFGLWGFYEVQGDLRAARELAEQLLTLAQGQHDPALLLQGHRALGDTLCWLGEFVQARAHLEQGIALYNPQRHRAHALLYGHDPGMGCRVYAALVLWVLGYPDQALQRSQEALSLAQELTHPFSLAFALTFTAWLHGLRWEWPAAQERAETLMALAREQGFAQWLAVGLMQWGRTLALQGQSEAGITQIRQGLAAYRATGAEFGRPFCLALLAETYGAGGQPAEGLRVLAEAVAAAYNVGERWYEAERHRLKGDLLLALSADHQAEAEACFQQALAVARQQQARSWELRAAISLGRLWQQQGKRVQAHQLLAAIYGWFTEGFDTADLQEAKALLAELA